jgi:hypothetical protein
MEPKVIYETFMSLSRAQWDSYAIGEEAIAARADLDRARAKKIAAGEIVGKNADEREAKAREILADEYARVEKVEAAEREARASLEVARIRVDEIKAELRLMEVLKPAGGAA